ncbi:MAG: hypothetical protein LBL25_02560, partial [Oscillospiraceae bacterium]|nr:hypothetical protein [Oscillospiraceae bacterium]
MSTVHNKPVSIDGKVFKRRGAWFGIYNFAFPGTEPALYLGTLHGMAALAPDKNRLINIAVTYNGESVPYTTSARPAELTLSTPNGAVRFTFADTAQIIAEGDPGMGLLFE